MSSTPPLRKRSDRRLPRQPLPQSPLTGKSSSSASTSVLNASSLHTSVLQGTSTPAPKEKSATLSDKSPVTALSTSNRGPNSSTNPFESMLMQSLDQATFSPSVFGKVLSPSEEEDCGGGSGFWSIEQQAIIQPAEIDEVPSLEQAAAESMSADPVTEASYQAAIDSFWARNPQIAPSPLDSPILRSRLAHHLLKAVPNSASPRQGGAASAFPAFAAAASASRRRQQQQQNEHPTPFRTSSPRHLPNSKASQTGLTIPPGIDLVSLLGPDFVYEEEANEEATSSTAVADLSANSLRRRLFAAHQEELFKDTPAQDGAEDEEEEAEWSSGAESPPLFLSTVQEEDEEVEEKAKPPASLQCSPIAALESPFPQ